jgi:dipeptidyl aminopeptidase/acylaminoacyl peptidase
MPSARYARWAAALLLPLAAQAQQLPNNSALSLPAIMQGEHFTGFSPDNPFWSEDNAYIYFDWNPEQERHRSHYRVSADGGPPERMPDSGLLDLPAAGSYTRDRSQKVYAKHGDIYWMHLAQNRQQAITLTVEQEADPRFSEDERHVVFRKGNNLYAWSIAEGNTRQLSQFVEANAPLGPIGDNEQDQWLHQDQLSYFQIIRERHQQAKQAEARMKAQRPIYPSPVYLGGKRIAGLRASPDLQYVVCQLRTPAPNATTQVPDYVTESGYTQNLNAREKVGAIQDRYEMGIYSVERDTFYMVDIAAIEGIHDRPVYMKDYHKNGTYHANHEEPRDVVVHLPIFSEEGHAVVDIRAADNKDRWIMLLDLGTGHLKLIDRQHDEAWIGGPGISGWNIEPGNMGWIDGHTLWFQSEETGYSHLYAFDFMSETTEALTQGNFEVLEASLSHDRSTFFLLTNEGSPHEQHFYHMPASGGGRTKITSRMGGHRVWVSPDERKLAVLFSESNRPWELFVMDNKPGASMRQLTISTTEAFEAYPWRKPDIVYFTAQDGAQVPARLYLPDNPTKKTPAVIFVHGAGYLQNVHHWWSDYFREYMFHNFLADNGYAVLDIDYRGSKGYGRDWRTGIYRHMGGKDLSDQVDGAKYLVEGLGINPNKIGIYGGSYGGFITLMAMFKAPGTFQCGAALRSVADWAHYNHPYTSNILNTPATDSIAYRRSSPIYFAEGLQGRLLMLHGMRDTNVHFQDVVRLSQRLIELGKDKWELAVFPMEGHGFVESSSWLDEYRRIYRMFQEELKE